jgi:hypothetical protein
MIRGSRSQITSWITLIAIGLPTRLLAEGSAWAPPLQSQCEIEANAFFAKHPDPGKMMENGFFPFWGSSPAKAPPPYRDAASGIVLSVDVDGRRVTAFDSDGKLLWVRDPFVDNDMCPYRSAHPYIFWIGAPGGDFGRHYLEPFTPTPDEIENPKIVKELNTEIEHGRKVERPNENDRFVGINFNSSQMGYMNIRNGVFYFMGQN